MPIMTGQKSPSDSSKNNLWSILLALAGVMVVTFLVILFLPERPVSSIPRNLEERMTYDVVRTYPHDPAAFTQGLIYLDGYLYESTGLYGESSLRRVDLETGAVLQQVNLEPDYFAEGLTEWEQTLIQLTWREQTGFVYALDDFTRTGHFQYPTEGWGLTHDGTQLIMSDGTNNLYFLDPDTFEEQGRVAVTHEGDPIHMLNELEFILGEVYANIWQTDMIVRINPETGAITGWIDLSGLLLEGPESAGADVLNGIAYDAAQDRLFVTGKLWPYLFEIVLIPTEPGE
jgi:glutaminyl-peptide cyclotransferase